MIKNYLITALRNLNRSRLYASINILGLGVGIACFTLLWLLIQHEWEHDRFHKNAQRIFRITERVERDGIGEHSSSVPFPLAEALRKSYPELVAQTVRLFDFQLPLFSIRYKETSYNEEDLYFTDANFFQLFDFPLAKGHPDSVLSKPFQVVVSHRVAAAYFGEEEALGQTIYFQGRVPLKVSGVLAAEQPPSHISADFLISLATLDSISNPKIQENWVWNPCWTYVLLQPNTDLEVLRRHLPAFTKKYLDPVIPDQVTLDLQALPAIHLSSHLDYELQLNSDMRYLYAFGVLGVLVLVIAALNFMQLAISYATFRAKEIAVRKVMGAERQALILQLLVESFLLGGLAILIAFILVEQLLPYVRTLSGDLLQPRLEGGWQIAQVVLGAGFTVTLLAGLYPAYFISGFDPIRIFSGKRANLPRREHFNRGLVRLQFAISVALLVFTMTNYRQIHFLQTFDLGFSSEDVLVVPMAQAADVRRSEYRFRKALEQSAAIRYAAAAEDILGRAHQTRPYVLDTTSLMVFAPSLFVGKDFQQTLGLKILAGSPFEAHDTIYDQVLINQSMQVQLGFGTPEEAVGQYVFFPASPQVQEGEQRAKKIQAVVEDFHFTSLHEPMAPFVLEYQGDRLPYGKFMMVRHHPGREAAAIEAIQRAWRDIAPDYSLEFFRLSDSLNQMYEQERILGTISLAFTLVAILIAAMGLFALAAFVVARREKEIGVRRVLGASTISLIFTLNKAFFRLILQSILIGWGIAFAVLYFWFQNFAYHVQTDWRVFLSAAALVFFITLLTISFHTIRAALSNPVRAIQRGV